MTVKTTLHSKDSRYHAISRYTAHLLMPYVHTTTMRADRSVAGPSNTNTYTMAEKSRKHLVVAVLSHCSTHAMHDRRAFSHLFLVRKRFCELFDGNLAIPVFVRLLAYALEHELGCFEIPVSTIS